MKYVETSDLPIKSLVAHPDNAKEHDESALDESVTANGQYRAVVVRPFGRSKWQILAGHGTTDALRRSGAEKVRCEVIEADDDAALNILLADNEIGRRAGYDRSKLVELLKQADSRATGFAGTGFDSAGYDDLLAKLAESAATPIPFGGSDVGGAPTGEDGGTVWQAPSLNELRDRYDAKGTRSVVFDLPVRVFEWLTEQFELLREARGVDSNADLLLVLVEEASGSKAPLVDAPVDPTPAWQDEQEEDVAQELFRGPA